MIKSNYFTSNSDMLLHFEKFVPWNEIVPAYENNFKDAKKYNETANELLATAPNNVEEAIEYYRTILDAAGDVTGNFVSERVKAMDLNGAYFENGKVTHPKEMIESVNKAKEAGIQAYGFQRKFGGLGLPFTVRALMGEIVYRVDTSFAIAFGCVNLGEILERIASKEMQEEWIPKMAAGDFCAAMGLTEPNHGSDLPNIRTKATKTEDGKWVLNGTKRFITQACGLGDTPSIILTLARSGGSGARGLSFFLVHSKDVQIAGIEKKMGLHASPTCEVVFENTPALLIGEEGFGLVRYTMGMLNGARMGIAAQGVGMATAALEEAKIFASTRIQFGKPIEEIPAIKKMLRRMEREILAMRCLTLEGGRTVDMYYWRIEHLREAGKSDKEISNDEEVRHWNKLADLLTPVSKYYCSEMCNRIAYDALQIHGGSGFTEDYDIARIYRDARIITIYDGTTQIQVMAAIGGVVSGMSATGNFRKYLTNEIAKFPASNRIQNLFVTLEEAVNTYKEIKATDVRDSFSLELVEVATRVLAGIHLEKTAHSLDGDAKLYRLKHAEEYNVDSFAISLGNISRMKDFVVVEKL
ncbi:MAG: acyl-CoA dehydrogenase family protein [Leptospiraceae bacterium]|nr:acyl-CoA dehydrogenase family protein [Leptospiraceae bacterium]